MTKIPYETRFVLLKAASGILDKFFSSFSSSGRLMNFKASWLGPQFCSDTIRASNTSPVKRMHRLGIRIDTSKDSERER